MGPLRLLAKRLSRDWLEREPGVWLYQLTGTGLTLARHSLPPPDTQKVASGMGQGAGETKSNLNSLPIISFHYSLFFVTRHSPLATCHLSLMYDQSPIDIPLPFFYSVQQSFVFLSTKRGGEGCLQRGNKGWFM